MNLWNKWWQWFDNQLIFVRMIVMFFVFYNAYWFGVLLGFMFLVD